MPELPEVETVKETLKKQVLHKVIHNVKVYYPNIISYPCANEFIEKCKNEQITNILRKGKWLLFELDHYYLLSHLRMEGKYFIRNCEDEKLSHEHVCFEFTDHTSLRYHDTRKFGRMYLLEKDKAFDSKPLSELGLEPFDENLNEKYLKEIYQKKIIPIKTTLLDQSIITGIGNIYADEILFLSKIHPLKPTNKCTKKNREDIIVNTKKVLEEAIKKGGTTIRSYTSSEGVHGLFQNELCIHGQKFCPICNSEVEKIRVGGRGTYYCSKCQKKNG